MKCQFCDHPKTRVLDSRPGKDNNHIRRRRQCSECDGRFTTFERLEENLALVVKRDGRMEPFDRNKMLAGLRRSCTKLPIAEDHLTRIAGLIENRIQESRRAAALQEIHPAAYIRYSMVHRQIQDLQDLQKLLDEELP
jgi:transcriptional repressor NrdR